MVRQIVVRNPRKSTRVAASELEISIRKNSLLPFSIDTIDNRGRHVSICTVLRTSERVMLQKCLEKPKEERKKDRKRQGLVVFGKRKRRDLGVLDRDADDESWTRIRKTPRGLYRDKLWRERLEKRGYHTG
ncbi:hypothetical protein TNCV_457961 [Trichonephila clavipes]|nr:hypothetical protein TNCV_457961 [Trichonephila clavipes]